MAPDARKNQPGKAPGNHSPDFVPDDVEKALHRGTAALLTAAAVWLAPGVDQPT
jgi:hypothetical protein